VDDAYLVMVSSSGLDMGRMNKKQLLADIAYKNALRSVKRRTDLRLEEET
jgi:hypothetical protein